MPENISEFRVADFEYRANESRQDGDALGTISGIVISYGDRARLPWGTEEFEAGAFKPSNRNDLIVNRMHLREQPLVRGNDVRIIDDKDSMRAEFDIPDNMYGRLVEDEVRRKVLRGLSLEFRTIKDEVDQKTNHRIIREARMFGFGVVDRPAYPRSKVALRWQEYASDLGFELESRQEREAPEWQTSGHYDHQGRYIIDTFVPVLTEAEVEARQTMPMLRGRLPYNVDGVVSMARNEHVRILPGAFAASLDGEILALIGHDYNMPVAGTLQRSLTLRDTEEYLEFRTRRIPDTSANRDFLANLAAGFSGIRAGWALQGSKTTTEPIEGGGNRIVVEEAMLCEFGFMSRSIYQGELIQVSRRSTPLLYRAV